MELIWPFMMIVLQWHPDHQGEFVIERMPELYETEADCEVRAAKFIGILETHSWQSGSAKYIAKCMPVPDEVDINEVVRRIEERVERERSKRAPDQEEQNAE